MTLMKRQALGPNINDDAAKVLNKVMSSKLIDDQIKQRLEKYQKPDSIVVAGVPKVNP